MSRIVYLGLWSLAYILLSHLAFTCRPPAPILNGVIEFQGPQSSRYNGGRVIAYSCNHGYILAGLSHRMCSMKVRGWTGNDPRCILIRCPTPVAPEHGYIDNTTRNKEGDTIRISCYGGYKLHGSSSMTCGSYADWSGTTPTCRKPDIGAGRCQAPAIPFGGRKIGLKSYRINDVITYRCNGDNLLVGPERIRCTNKGWLPKRQPKCKVPFSYDNPTELAEKFARLFRKLKDETKQDGNGVGTRERRYLDVNSPTGIDIHFLIDASGSITIRDFRSAVNFVKTLVKMIGDSDQPNGARVGVLTFSHSAVSDSMGRFGDSSGFFANRNMTMERVLESLDALSWSGGGTNIRGALEFVRTHMIPLSLMQRELARQYVFLLSDGESNMGGNPIPKAQQLKCTPLDVDIFCIKIGVDRDARRNIQNIQKLLAISSEEELNQDGTDPHFFRLKDYPAFDMLVQQLVFRKIDYGECGIAGKTGISSMSLGNIIGGNLDKPRAWPWMAAVMLASANDLGVRDHNQVCGGTVLNNEWILTAAHCFQGDAYNNPRRVMVKLGANKMTQLQENDPLYVRDMRVKSMHIHEAWIVNAEKKKLDDHWANDIALLRLADKIHFSKSVRPICLISKNASDRDIQDEIAVVTGWGKAGNESLTARQAYEQTSSRELRQVRLPVVTQAENPSRCYDRYPAEKVICAGSTYQLIDACVGDAGGPLMIELGAENYKPRWYQIGILSNGFGCAQLNRNVPFGRYTDVRKYRDWIEATIRNAGP